MIRADLEKRKGELQASLAQLRVSMALVQGALMEVEQWLGKCEEAEKGAMAGVATAPLTPDVESENGRSDESRGDCVYPAEAGVP